MPTHKRTRTGCWTCREAGYKCDEGKPQCARCLRLKITCKGYGVKLKWQDGNSRTPSSKSKKSRKKVAAGEDLAISPGSRVSTTARSWTTGTISTSPESVKSLPFVPVSPPVISYSMSASDRWLLQYWVEHLSTLISVAPRNGQSTPFQLHLTVMMHGSKALQSTVLSMAANHLALSSNDRSLRVQAYRHQQDAIHELQTMIQDPQQATTEPALATVLMMQVSARLFGDDNDATVANHLAGAKAMIARRANTPTPITQFLLSLFAYHDILASVSRGTHPLAAHDATFAAVENNPDMHAIARILLAVARISDLQHARKARRAANPDPPLTAAENTLGLAIQHTLLAMESEAESDLEAATEPHITHTTHAYHHAALIYLLRTWRDIGAPNPLTLHHVTDCLAHLRRVPASSPLATYHVWPLFTAGCEAVDAAERAFVKERFAEMWECKRFPSLRRVSKDVSDVWAAKDGVGVKEGGEGMMGVDCIRVLLGRGREVELA